MEKLPLGFTKPTGKKFQFQLRLYSPMIDANLENLIPVSESPKHYPGFRPHISMCHRHRQRGVKGHRLETLLIGGRRFTSKEAIQRFIAAINSRFEPSPSVVRKDNQLLDELDRSGF